MCVAEEGEGPRESMVRSHSPHYTRWVLTFAATSSHSPKLSSHFLPYVSSPPSFHLISLSNLAFFLLPIHPDTPISLFFFRRALSPLTSLAHHITITLNSSYLSIPKPRTQTQTTLGPCNRETKDGELRRVLKFFRRGKTQNTFDLSFFDV